MNLNLVPLGWVHLIASTVAIAVALVMLVRPKGNPIHKRRGRVYVAAILITGCTALAIYRRGVFFFPHWFAIASLATTAIAFSAVRFKIPARGWVHVHLTAMLTSVYILFGGAVNEAYLRVDVLRHLSRDLRTTMIDLSHLAVVTVFAALILYFNVREWRRNATIVIDGDEAVVGAKAAQPAGNIPR
jgi:uncharacterized membrane protein